MAIRKRGDSWQIDVLVPTGQKDDEGREIQERIRKTFKKKREAEAEHDKIRTLVREKRFLDVKREYKTTLRELVDKYDENYRHQAIYKTSKKTYLENFKNHFGEDTRLSSIRYVELESYRNQVRQKPTHFGTARTPASVNREMACLHHLFAKAVEWDLMEQNPFDRGNCLLLKENNKRLRYLSEAEILRLLESSKDQARRDRWPS